jgi:hypothetical protein
VGGFGTLFNILNGSCGVVDDYGNGMATLDSQLTFDSGEYMNSILFGYRLAVHVNPPLSSTQVVSLGSFYPKNVIPQFSSFQTGTQNFVLDYPSPSMLLLSI